MLDNTRYNHSKQVKAWLARDDCRIELVHLPAYAPNLNLIERFWCLFRKSAICNESYPTFADFKMVVPCVERRGLVSGAGPARPATSPRRTWR